SVGGVLGGIRLARTSGVAICVVVLPFLVTPIESRFHPAAQLRHVETQVEIRAPRAKTWENVIEVRGISRTEYRPTFFHAIGFPRPVAATVTGHGVGAVRHATFAGGVLFLETVDRWEEGKRLSFSIAAQTDQIPAITLDEHVKVGGEYFDVLRGTYEL